MVPAGIITFLLCSLFCFSCFCGLFPRRSEDIDLGGGNKGGGGGEWLGTRQKEALITQGYSSAKDTGQLNTIFSEQRIYRGKTPGYFAKILCSCRTRQWMCP